MKPNLYEIWFADIEYTDNKGIYDNRPVFVLRKEGSKYVVLKGTTSSKTKEPFYQIEDISECGLYKDTKIILSRKYIIPEKYFTKYVGQVSDNDLVNIVSSLLSQKIYIYFQEKLILDESLFEEYNDNNKQLYKEIASQVRKEIVDKYGEDFLYGKCIEASEKIVELLSKERINSNTIEGWVHYDYDDGCTDRDYDEHTWVETQDGYVIDVTATQFNHFMDEDYPAVIISKELPYGYSYDEPDAYEDSDFDDDWSYKNLLESKKRKKKKISQVKAGDPIFKSIKDMQKWVKKRQKGMSPWGMFNTNAGNVPLSNSIFNSTFSSDGSSGVGTSDGGISNGGLSSVGGGDIGGGMGESWYLDEANKHKSKNANQNVIKDLKWYETLAGNLPAKDFYDNCNPYIKKLFDNLFKLLKHNQLAQIKDCSKLLDSKEHIFELRLKDGDFWYRLTYFRADDGNILLTGFTKKRNETDDIEIQKAIKCKKNYLLYRRGQNIDVK